MRPPISGPADAGRKPNPSSRSSGRLHLSLVRPVAASPSGRLAAVSGRAEFSVVPAQAIPGVSDHFVQAFAGGESVIFGSSAGEG